MVISILQLDTHQDSAPGPRWGTSVPVPRFCPPPKQISGYAPIQAAFCLFIVTEAPSVCCEVVLAKESLFVTCVSRLGLPIITVSSCIGFRDDRPINSVSANVYFVVFNWCWSGKFYGLGLGPAVLEQRSCLPSLIARRHSIGLKIPVVPLPQSTRALG